MKIAFFELKEWEKEILPQYAQKLNAEVYPYEIEEALDLAADYEILSTFIYSDLSAKNLQKLPQLKMIATRSTGFDHIDINYCKKHKITVCNVPSYGENTVAEHTFALILALSRRLIPSVNRVRQGSFSPAGLTGFDLKGKTIGVVGVGAIGQWVVRYSKAFGMKVLGVTSSSHPQREKRLGYKRVPLELCLTEADIVTLHVPYCKATHHLINRQNIKRMKKGSYLINTARGPVIETEAILWALEQGILAGAGLDVLEEEEILDDPNALFSQYVSRDDLAELVTAHLLREKPNVIITPHNAFNSNEAVGRIIETTYANIVKFQAGRPQNTV